MKACKIFDWCYGHSLDLPYDSKCLNYHGHNAKVEVEVEGPLNSNGMVMDFIELKNKVNSISFDHKHLNDIKCPFCNGIAVRGIMEENPTAENLVLLLKKWLDEIPFPINVKIRRIRVYETDSSFAEEEW